MLRGSKANLWTKKYRKSETIKSETEFVRKKSKEKEQKRCLEEEIVWALNGADES